MKRTIIRIKDIAEKAGTSKGTVDRVLHNRGRVAPEVRERIQAIIKELNYEPNRIAQSLKSQRTYNISALIPDPKQDSYWESPLNGILKAEKELRQYGINVTPFIFDPHDVSSFIAKAREVTAEAPDGVLIAPIFYKETLPFFSNWRTLNIPYVLFNTQIEDAKPLCYIGQDSYRSGFLAAKILKFGLLKQGTILVAHINEDSPNSAHLISKEEGFRDYFKQNQESGTFKIISKDINFQESEGIDTQLAAILAEEPVSAVYVTNSKAFEVARYLEKSGHDGIKLIGYDLLESNLHHLNTERIQFLINQNPWGQGYWGIHQLANHLIFKEKVLPIKFLPLDIITKENLDYYLEPA